jgi:membrane protease YdiL (CAAX protease family)
MFILVVIFLINSIRYRKEIKDYVKYGVVLGLILISFDIVVVALIPNYFVGRTFYQLLIIDVIAFVKILIFTCMGIYYCSTLGIVDIPLIKRLSGKVDALGTSTGLNCIISIAGVGLGGVVFSVILFKLTAPHLSDFVKELLKLQGAKPRMGNEPSVLMALILIAFAFGEEILFRLGIQNFLAKQFRLNGNRYWIAVVVTSGIWSLGHANTLNPEWVKMVQIFPLGIALGFLFKRYGLESCIIAHGIFNLIMMGLGPDLINMG